MPNAPGPSGVDLFRLAVDLSPSGMLAVDETGAILLVNREIERLFGYPRDELIGKSVDMLVPERFRTRHPEFRGHFFSLPQARPMGMGPDLYGLRKDGTEVPVEIGLNPVRTPERLVVLASVVDIGARKRAEQRFQAAVESSPSGMVMTDEAGTILLVNHEVERLFGHSRNELIGRPVEMLVPARLRPIHPRHRAQFYTDPGSRPMGMGRELYGLRKDGTEIPIEIGLNPIRTDEGMCVLSSIVDVTERRRVEEQLRQSQKLEAIGTLAGGIAHDFNNILLSIIGHTELAQRPAVNELQRADLDQVLKAAERGRRLVQRILAFSRPGEIRRTSMAIERPVHEALQLLRASLPTTIEMREILDPEAPIVQSDETQIHQMLMNLATNAAHAMPEGGVLEVRLGPFQVSDAFASSHPSLSPGLYARLSVKDTGHGMPPEVAERAFEPFFTTKPTGTGTGLGLSVIHGIVQSHGGAIEIQSRPNEGTRVDIYLPAHVASPLDRDNHEKKLDSDRPHILVVEDEEDLILMLRRQLHSLGYRVTTHTSSVEALEDFRARPADFHLLITDNTMPRLTGLALAQEIRSLRSDLPILLISGLAETSDPDELKRKGITRLLSKPHTSRQLGEVIEELLP